MKPKKQFGQHFLSNRSILESMIRAGRVTSRDTVLEVGPGTGTLTELLAKKAGRVVAVEKDRELVPLLQEKFKNMKNVEIFEGDILNNFFVPFEYNLKHAYRYKVVANIPYYLTGRLIRLFLEARHKPSTMILMIQREVANRIVARDGKESLLSLSIKAYGTPKIVRIVPRGAFHPPPTVDSAIIAINNISNNWFSKNVRHSVSNMSNKHIKPEEFFVLLRKAFQNKRKILKNSLKIKPDSLCYTQCSTYMGKRPEELSLKDWAKIIHVLH